MVVRLMSGYRCPDCIVAVLGCIYLYTDGGCSLIRLALQVGI